MYKIVKLKFTHEDFADFKESHGFGWVYPKIQRLHNHIPLPLWFALGQ